jgi:glycosyltransferase involved in cell wall biosynthesis
MALDPTLDLHVAYCSLRGAQVALDPEFGITVQWDIPLLDGYSWVELPNRGSGGEGFFGLRNSGLWKLIREGNFDAVLCYTGYLRASFWIAYFAAKFSGAAFIFGTDAAALGGIDGRMWKIRVKKLFWPFLYRLADQVIVSSAAGVELMRSLRIPAERITLTPFVVDNDWWSAQASDKKRAAARNSWGVAPSQLVVLFCAKLQTWKRPLDLLHAFALANVPNAVLVFAGEGPLRSQLEARAATLGLGERVRFLGFVNQTQLPAVYCGADLFVLPSSYDACPVVVCEAMLCGLPVVLSDEIRGRFDLVRPGLTGEIFPCGEVSALGSTLRRLLNNPSALAVLSRNARARMDTWSLRENIVGTIEAIRVAVQRRHKNARVSSPHS